MSSFLLSLSGIGRINAIFTQFQQHAETIRALITAGADPKLKSSTGFTALKWAEASHHQEIIDALRSAGARE